MTKALLVFAVLSVTAACGGEYGPVGTFTIPTHVAEQKTSRLTVDLDGTIHDTHMNDQVCVFALDSKCQSRCFPIEMMWCGRDVAQAQWWYTRQGLTKIFDYGRLTTPQDPSCFGQSTYRLVDIMYADNNARPTRIQTCDQVGADLSPSLYDRNWYTAKPSAIAPAMPEDLPVPPS